MTTAKIAVFPFHGGDGNGYVISGKRARTYDDLIDRVREGFQKNSAHWQLHFHFNQHCKLQLIPSEWDAGAYFDEEFLKYGHVVLYAHFEPKLTEGDRPTPTATTSESFAQSAVQVKEPEETNTPQEMQPNTPDQTPLSLDTEIMTSSETDPTNTGHEVKEESRLEPFRPTPTPPANFKAIRTPELANGQLPERIKQMHEVADGSIEIVLYPVRYGIAYDKGIIVGYSRVGRSRDPLKRALVIAIPKTSTELSFLSSAKYCFSNRSGKTKRNGMVYMPYKQIEFIPELAECSQVEKKRVIWEALRR